MSVNYNQASMNIKKKIAIKEKEHADIKQQLQALYTERDAVFKRPIIGPALAFGVDSKITIQKLTLDMVTKDLDALYAEKKNVNAKSSAEAAAKLAAEQKILADKIAAEKEAADAAAKKAAEDKARADAELKAKKNANNAAAKKRAEEEAAIAAKKKAAADEAAAAAAAADKKAADDAAKAQADAAAKKAAENAQRVTANAAAKAAANTAIAKGANSAEAAKVANAVKVAANSTEVKAAVANAALQPLSVVKKVTANIGGIQKNINPIQPPVNASSPLGMLSRRVEDAIVDSKIMISNLKSITGSSTIPPAKVKEMMDTSQRITQRLEEGLEVARIPRRRLSIPKKRPPVTPLPAVGGSRRRSTRRAVSRKRRGTRRH